jgi:integrase
MKYTSVSVREVNGRWYARLRGKDNSNKWKGTDRVLKDVKGKREAKKKAIELMEEVNKELSLLVDDSLPKETRTIEEVVKDYLDNQLEMGELKESTHYVQTITFKEHAEPYIGNVVFDTLDRDTINIWLSKLSKKYSQVTIRKVVMIVNKVYRHYANIGEISNNPFDFVKKPRAKSIKTTHLTNEQMNNFLIAVYSEYEPKDWMYAALHLAFFGGLRRGELCALRWRNVDFETMTITIDSAIAYRKGGFYTKEVKTNSSNRTFYMNAQLAEALSNVYKAVKPEPNWYVCGNGTEFISPAQLNHRFASFREAYDLKDAYGKDIILHGLRHNVGAVGIASKMDIASLSNMLGHSSMALTLDVYGDASEDAKIVSAQRLTEGFIKKADPDEDFFQRRVDEEEEEVEE